MSYAPFEALTPSGVNSKPTSDAVRPAVGAWLANEPGVLAVDADEQDVGLVGLDLRQHLREVLAADGHELVQVVELVAGVGDLLEDVLLDDAVARLADVPADEADGLRVGLTSPSAYWNRPGIGSFGVIARVPQKYGWPWPKMLVPPPPSRVNILYCAVPASIAPRSSTYEANLAWMPVEPSSVIACVAGRGVARLVVDVGVR